MVVAKFDLLENTIDQEISNPFVFFSFFLIKKNLKACLVARKDTLFNAIIIYKTNLKMNKTIQFLAFCLLVNISFAQQKDDNQLFADFDKMLSETIQKPTKTGATALVARKGQIIYKKAFGMANLEYNIPMQVDNIFQNWLYYQAIYGGGDIAIDGARQIEFCKTKSPNLYPIYPTQWA
jgi:hypothetical protein